VIRWLRTKMDLLTEEFLSGGGWGQLYEAQFLVYLECFVVARGGDGSTVWTKLRELRQMETPEGEEVRGYSHVLDDRKELATALTIYHARFDTPQATKLQPEPIERPKTEAEQAQKPAPARSKSEGLDLFNLLDGGDED
jgi:hypothetical protein